MIPLALFDSEKNSLELKLVKYVNDNLKVIVRQYLEYLNADDGFDIQEKLLEVMPRDYNTRNPEECRKYVDELYCMG